MGVYGPTAASYGAEIPITAVKTSGRSRAASYAIAEPQSWLFSENVSRWMRRQLERVIRLAQSRLLAQHWHASRYTIYPQSRRRLCQRIGRPLDALIHQSHEDWGRLYGNHSADRMRKWHILGGQKEKGMSDLKLLNLIFPAGPETRPAMQEQERTIGIPVTTIKILYRAKIESMDRKMRLWGAYGGTSRRSCFLHG